MEQIDEENKTIQEAMNKPDADEAFKGPRKNNFTFLPVRTAGRPGGHLIFRPFLSDFHSLNPRVAQATLAVGNSPNRAIRRIARQFGKLHLI